ncbi:MAG: Mur ligase domain-containing protein, partial [Rikenellaceae bacterium]
MKYSLSEIANIVNGKLSGSDATITNIIYDSRKLVVVKTTLFVAIKGTMRDGHLYVKELVDKGVRAFLVDEGFDTSVFKKEVGFVVV